MNNFEDAKLLKFSQKENSDFLFHHFSYFHFKFSEKSFLLVVLQSQVVWTDPMTGPGSVKIFINKEIVKNLNLVISRLISEKFPSRNCHFLVKITKLITRMNSRSLTNSPYIWFDNLNIVWTDLTLLVNCHDPILLPFHKIHR